MKQTETYKLSLIETSDTFSPEALNGNMEKVEQLFRGQLQFAWGEYTGDGKYGAKTPKRLEFDFKPLIVWVCHASDEYYGHHPWLRGAAVGRMYHVNSTTWCANLTWEDRAVQWYHFSNERLQLNEKDTRYVYAAIGVLD